MVERLVSSRYVVRDRQILNGEPIIVSTQIPVRDIVALWQDGIPPEKISDLLYCLVSTAQVFDALSFYYDQKTEIDEYIAKYTKLGVMNRSAILLSHDPDWDEFERAMQEERKKLDAVMTKDN